MATFVIELAEAGTQPARLVDQVAAGAVVTITRDGRPVARLVPPLDAEVAPDRIPGSARGLFRVPDDFDAPLDDFREY